MVKKKAPGPSRTTLSKILAPFRAQFRAASRRPKGHLPGWFQNLSPSLQEQVKREAFSGDSTKLPDPAAIGNAVLEFWSR